MISLLGITSPFYLLLAIPAIAGLLYAYSKRGKAKKEIVASLIFLESLRKRTVAKKKVRFPIRLFYELLLLLILILIISGVYLSNSHKTIIVLLDNSLSMSAKVNENNSTISLFNKAKHSIENELKANASFSTTAKLCITSPRLECLNSDFTNMSSVISKLDETNISYSADNLELAIKQIQNQSYNNLFVFTDKKLINKKNNKIKLYTQKASPVSNIVLKKVAMVPNSENIEITVNSHSKLETKASIILNSFKQEGNSLREEDSLKKEVILKANLDNKFILKYNKNLIYQVNIDVNDSYNDTIKTDNDYWLTPSQSKDETILFVSNEKVTHNLDSLTDYPIINIRELEYESSYKNKKNKLIIFYNTNIKQLPISNYIIVTPQTDGLVKTNIKDNPIVTNWNNESKLLKYLKYDGFKFTKSITAKLPNSYKTIIGSQNEALLAMGSLDGVSSVYLGFDIFPVSKYNKSLSILTLNILNELAKKTNRINNLSLDSKVQEDSKQYYYDNSLKKLELSNNDIISKKGIIFSKNKFIAINSYLENESKTNIIYNIELEKYKNKVFESKFNTLQKQLIIASLIIFLLGILIWSKEDSE